MRTKGVSYSQKFRAKCSFPNLVSDRTSQFMFGGILLLHYRLGSKEGVRGVRVGVGV